ncbi:hypothetical protein VB636_03295, partial [Paracoccus sp. APAP_BH8]
GAEFASGAAGVKYQGRTDVMLVRLAPGTAIAGAFTKSSTRAASVLEPFAVVFGAFAANVLHGAMNAVPKAQLDRRPAPGPNRDARPRHRAAGPRRRRCNRGATPASDRWNAARPASCGWPHHSCLCRVHGPAFRRVDRLGVAPVRLGSTLRPQSDLAKARIATELQERLWPLVEAGAVRPLIDSTFPLAEARKEPAMASLPQKGTSP